MMPKADLAQRGAGRQGPPGAGRPGLPGAGRPAPLTQLRDCLRASGLDACILTGNSDLRWLTGFEQVFDDERAHTAFVTADEAVIHTDLRYSTMMRERAARAQASGQGSAWRIDDERVAPSAFAAKRIAEAGGAGELRVCIEADLPLNRFRALEKALGEAGAGITAAARTVRLVEKEDLTCSLRAVKDAEEESLMRQAQAIADRAFLDLLPWLASGRTELEVANQLEHLARLNGAEGMSFATIVASGPNGASPHAVPTRRELAYGDFVVIDFGVRYRDYCSDATRTVCIGKPSARRRGLYDAVLEAHEAARAAVMPGMAAKDVHARAADALGAHGLADMFTHGLGHGVGIDIHELPAIGPKSEAVLAEGNVVTVEPGVYLPGDCGIRIEDCGIVKAEGFESFTGLSKELVCV
jgi:Xaa-Pro aminopeptidase